MEEPSQEVFSNWWDIIDDDGFQMNFRMSRSTFISLQAELDDMEGIDNEETNQFLLCCVWVLGNTIPLENAAAVFDINESIEEVLMQFLKKIIALGEQYLTWPDVTEAKQIEQGFLNIYKFPGVIGVVGSLHISILPDAKHALYYNREMKKHTIILQVVCDNNLLLRDVCAGCPGGKDIETILRCSPLYAKLSDENGYLVKNGKHLLGGTEHPYMKTLLTPYRGINLNERQTKFNALHGSVMYTVEKTFSFLENRFPRLTCMDTLSPQLATLLVSAASVLHNFTRVRKDACDLYTNF